MTSFLVRGWRYLGAAVGDALDRISDPRLQVQMALEETRRRHQLLTEQAAAVLGNERELEIKVGRAMADVERLRTAAGRALVLADRAYRDGLNQGQYDRSSNRRNSYKRSAWRQGDSSYGNAYRSHSYRPTQGDNYKHADRGYDSRFGNKDGYKQTYRSGYLNGYEQGYQRGR